MPAYAVAQLRNVTMNEGLQVYVKSIDETLRPYSGRFIIHGAEKVQLEGYSAGDLIIITFPDIADARAWYHSPAYQALIPLRQQACEGELFLMNGVDENHRAIDIFSG
ncbi:MAG: DUF1330 domain-containing protein [Bdellovibrionia bacterium]